jgi:hypothetical protein
MSMEEQVEDSLPDKDRHYHTNIGHVRSNILGLINHMLARSVMITAMATRANLPPNTVVEFTVVGNVLVVFGLKMNSLVEM